MEQDAADIVVQSVALHRTARIPDDAVQRQLIANDPAAAVDQLLPRYLHLSRAHQVINASALVSAMTKKKYTRKMNANENTNCGVMQKSR